MNMMAMMKKAKDMQKNMGIAQKELETTVVKGSAGGGAVEVQITCAYKADSVSIKPEAVDADDVETLEDLVQAAVSDALVQAGKTIEARMQEVTGGMSLPGM